MSRSRGRSIETSRRLCSPRSAPASHRAVSGHQTGRGGTGCRHGMDGGDGGALGLLGQGQAEVGDLVAQQRRLLVAQLRGAPSHLLLQAQHERGQLARRQPGQLAQQLVGRRPAARSPGAAGRAAAASPGPGRRCDRTGAGAGRCGGPAPLVAAVGPPRPGVVGRAQPGQDVGHRLADGGRVDAVLGVVGLLQGPPALGLADGRAHGVGDGVGVEHDVALDVPRGAAHGLDERRGRAQEAGLVGVEDGHQLHLGQVEALAQQVDADQDVELPQPQVAQQLDAGDGVDVGVEIAHAHAELEQVVGQVLGHLLGQGGDEDPPVRWRPWPGSAPAGRRSGPWWGRSPPRGRPARSAG